MINGGTVMVGPTSGTAGTASLTTGVTTPAPATGRGALAVNDVAD